MFSSAVETLVPVSETRSFIDPHFAAAKLPWLLWERAAIQMLGAVAQGARLATLPQRLGDAIEEAKGIERVGKVKPLINALSNFDIETTRIDGRQVPVTKEFGSVSSTCDYWYFSRPEHDSSPTVALLAPYSGSHAMVMAPLAEKLLPHRNVVIIGWHDARNLKPSIRFDVTQQARDTIEAIHLFSESGYQGLDLVAPSQAGIPAALAAGSTGAIQNLFLVGCPMNTAPQFNIMDIMEHPLHWMAQYPTLPSSLFIDAGPNRIGHGSRFLSQQVMHTLYGCTSDSMKMDCVRQGLSAPHIEQMHGWIFRDNRLAKGQIELTNGPVSLKSYDRTLTTIAAVDDGIVPPYFTHRAHEIFPGIPKENRNVLNVAGGHYDLVQPGPTLDQIASAILRVSFLSPRPH